MDDPAGCGEKMMHETIYTNLKGIRREMLKILGEVSSLANGPMTLEDALDDFWHPKCDVYQTSDEWVIVLELAGVEKDEINISMSPEYLRISGTRSFSSCGDTVCYYNMEIETGRFDRRIYFPDIRVDKDNPKVSYAGGILRVAFSINPIVERIIPIE